MHFLQARSPEAAELKSALRKAIPEVQQIALQIMTWTLARSYI